jgi:cytochrome b561
MTSTPSTPTHRDRARPRVREVYRYLGYLFVALVAAQFFLAGLGTFGLDTKVADSDAFDAHMVLGMTINVVALVILIVAIFARLRRAQIVAAALLFVLTTGTGFVAGSAADDPNRVLGGLHALLGVLILAISLWIVADLRTQ